MPAVVGVFPDRDETATAIDQLVGLGIDPESLGVVWREKTVGKYEETERVVYVDHFDDPGAEARKGALGGAVGGGAAGVGSVILATTGGVIIGSPIGALLAVGTLGAAAVAGAAGVVGGSITGGVLGALLGATDHDATKKTITESEYRDVIERDGFVLTVTADKDGVDRVSDAMAQVGASDISVLREQGESLRRVTLRRDEDT
jgi:hypothetical protein